MRFTSAKAPGAPVEPTGIVVSLACPKHGQPLPESIGCVFLTAIGATYFAALMPSVCAVAVAPTCTELMPKSLAKNPGDGRVTCTETRSFGTMLLETETSFVARSGVFFVAYCCAREVALPGALGKRRADRSPAGSPRPFSRPRGSRQSGRCSC